MDIITQFMGNMGVLTVVCVAVPFLIVALILAAVVIRAGRKARVSQVWPSAMGQVLAAHLEARSSRNAQGSTTTAYFPVVVYQYSVGGQTYQSDRMRFGMDVGEGLTRLGQRVVDRYPPGSQVEVFYNPDDPTEAVLERNARTPNRILTCVVIAIVGLVLVAAVFTLGSLGLIQQIFDGIGIGNLVK